MILIFEILIFFLFGKKWERRESERDKWRGKRE
jgi:hypothetical protein